MLQIMIRYCLISLLLLTGIAHAEVYRWVDKNGNVVFSDSPPAKGSPESRKAEKIKIAPITTVPSFKPQPEPQAADATSNSKDTGKERATVGRYTVFVITSPPAGESVRNNAGNVNIEFDVVPPLDVVAGHSVHVFMDGEEVANGQQTGFVLNNVDRGTHTLYGEIKNLQGDLIGKTNRISFTLQRHSVLFNKPSNSSPGAPLPSGGTRP